ncbi:MAG: hypothetical protein PF487_09490 [Bacteroidales bacterium]|jgi:hypothetical protein|nr:hypothetical protein [Bacteroidales bacterium]
MNTQEEYIKQAKTKIDVINLRIKKHKYNAILSLEETEKEVNNQIDELDEKQKYLDEAIAKLKYSNDTNWESAIEEFENSIQEDFFETLKNRMYDMGEEIKDWSLRTDETKNAFLNKAKNEIHDLNIGISQLEKRASETQEFTRKKIKEQIEFLKQKKNEMQTKFEEASNSDDNAWSNIKKGFEESKGFFKRKFSDIKNSVK